MNQMDAIRLIDDHKNQLLNPVEMLDWTWLRVIINNLTDDEWKAAVERASEILSQ